MAICFEEPEQLSREPDQLTDGLIDDLVGLKRGSSAVRDCLPTNCLALSSSLSSPKKRRQISPDRLALVLSAQEEIIDDEDPVPPADTTADNNNTHQAQRSG